MASNYSKITLSKEDGVARVTLNDPPMNIMDMAMVSDLLRAFDGINQDEAIKVVLLTGAGDKGFTAGASVEEHFPGLVEEMIPLFHKLIKQVIDTKAVTLAAIDGICLGGGLELAAACDLMVVTPESRLGQPEILLASMAPVAGPLLSRIVGRRRAAEIVLAGKSMSGIEAMSMGLANRLIPAEVFEKMIEEMAASIASRSGPVLRLAKRSLVDHDKLALFEEIDRNERLYMDELLQVEDMAEGLRSFLEKRKPVWRGR